MSATKRFPVSIDVVLLGVICLTWASVAIGYHVAGIMPAGRRVWTAGTVLILAITATVVGYEIRGGTV